VGLAAAVAADAVNAAARAVAAGGFHSFWLNNPPGASALSMLGRLGPVVDELWLGVGVIPLTHHSPEQIAADARQSNVPLDRLYLGVGTGGAGYDTVALALPELRGALDCTLVVGALGPRMCRLAGAQADGVLLNWLTPDWARRSLDWVREGAEQAGRDLPRVMAYVRVALGDGATARLRKESANYEGIPAYARHFQRMGVSAFNASISGKTEASLQEQLARWDGVVDEVVVRAIAENDTAHEIVELVEAVRPGS
jgi:alkanesulfonate monooxygenase SsuD/methylene tetrahydromethanopterin reductase-like flavin-dependent oxidoreductase (luciferase family)